MIVGCWSLRSRTASESIDGGLGSRQVAGAAEVRLQRRRDRDALTEVTGGFFVVHRRERYSAAHAASRITHVVFGRATMHRVLRRVVLCVLVVAALVRRCDARDRRSPARRSAGPVIAGK